ncbi:MAG: cytochrome c peroxidase [Alphaproteobacteria bacterium]
MQIGFDDSRKGLWAAAYAAAFVGVGGLIVLGAEAQSAAGDARATLRAAVEAQGVEALQPPPAEPDALVELGRMLFFDPELSGNRNISCATCHHPAFGIGDGLSVSFGSGGVGLGTGRDLAEGALIPRNAPEVFNRGDSHWHTMFWDSRVEIAADGTIHTPAGDQMFMWLDTPLALQAMFPVTSRDEMRGQPGDIAADGRENEIAAFEDEDFVGMWQALADRLLAIPAYVALFQQAYPDVAVADLTFAHAAQAIAAFEIQAFAFTDSPWDRWLAGEDDALTDAQVEGALLFYGEAGCATCHSGPLMTDQQHHNIGTPQIGPGRGASAPLDFGRFLVSGEGADLFGFRTPPLRNVALTGPWMHNGAFHTLDMAIRHHFDPSVCWTPDFQFVSLEAEIEPTIHREPGLRAAVLASLAPELPRFQPTDAQVAALAAFLEALSAPSVASTADQVPATVPSGLPVDTVAAPGEY